MSVTLREATSEEAAVMTPVRQGYWEMTANTAGLFAGLDFAASLRSALRTDTFLPAWSSWFGGRHISLVKDHDALREILKHPRSDPNGIFYLPPNKDKYARIVGEIFPEYTITNNDIILWCDKEHAEKYRALILSHLRGVSPESIAQIADDEISQWSGSVSLNRINTFTSTVLSSFLLGKSSPFEAIETFNQGILRRATGLPGSAAYQASLVQIHDTIEDTLTNSNAPFIEALKQSDLTPAQQRMMLVILFFAGQETSASALTYMIWDLALHPEKQEEIFQEVENDDVSAAVKRVGNYTTIQKIVAMGLFNHPPAYAFARVANKNLVMEFGEVKRFIPKGQQLNGCPLFAKDKQPNLTPSNFPFSHGPNSCPGQHLALREIRLFLIALISKFRFTTTQKDVKQVSGATMKLEPEIFIQVEKRS